MTKLFLGITFASVLVFLASTYYALKKAEALEEKINILTKETSQNTSENLTGKPEHEDEHVLISSMQRFQWFGNKLWFAGNAENWELADFYTHELEEVAEEVIKSKITDDGADISSLMKELAIPRIEELEKSVKSKDKKQFLENYKLLVSTCNTCHQTSGKSFIKIKSPEKPITDMQDF